MFCQNYLLSNKTLFIFLAERSRLLGREIASSFIKEESSQLEGILNGSIPKKKSIQELLNKKSIKLESGRDSINNNKDPLI